MVRVGKGSTNLFVPLEQIALAYEWSYMDEKYARQNTWKKGRQIFLYIAKQYCSRLGQQARVGQSLSYNIALEEGLFNISLATSSCLTHHDIIMVWGHRLSGLNYHPHPLKSSWCFHVKIMILPFRGTPYVLGFQNDLKPLNCWSTHRSIWILLSFVAQTCTSTWGCLACRKWLERNSLDIKFIKLNIKLKILLLCND